MCQRIDSVEYSETTMPSSSTPGDSTLVADGGPSQMALGHVLIVEDDEDLADLFRAWIKGFYGDDATVRVATTVADAEATLATLSKLDIALIDRTLPDGDGTDLLPVIESRFGAITVMVTGASPDTDLIELPVDDYLVKPIEEESLIKRLSLLEKLDAGGVLQPYAEAHKASMLEYHLDEPEQDPLFRRFANRWSYDRLEIAHIGDQQLVYALYTGSGPEEDISVSITGALDPDVTTLLGDDKIAPVGELVPTDDGYAWIDADGLTSVDSDADSITIYEFACETPQQYVTDTADEGEGLSHRELREILASAFR